MQVFREKLLIKWNFLRKSFVVSIKLLIFAPSKNIIIRNECYIVVSECIIRYIFDMYVSHTYMQS